MKKEKKKSGSQWKQLLAMIPFLIIGCACGALMAKVALRNDTGDTGQMLLSCAVLFVGMYVGMFLQIAIHEAGHLVFGLVSGYRFSSYRIGSFMWLMENGTIRFRRFSLAGTGGQCLMIPPELVDGEYPVMLYNLGGCILNLAAGAVFIGLYFLLGDSIPGTLSMITGIAGLMFALSNGIPARVGGVANDGYNALSLRKDPLAMRSFWLQLKINEQVARGMRLKDMPEDWFTLPTDEEMKNVMTSAIGAVCCNRLVDEHRFAEADELMKHLMEIDSAMLELHRNMLTCDRITCCLLLGKNDDILSRMEDKDFVKIRRVSKANPGVHRTEYISAVLRVRDDTKAREAMKNFEKYAKRYPYPGEIAAERELMELARVKGEKTVC